MCLPGIHLDWLYCLLHCREAWFDQADREGGEPDATRDEQIGKERIKRIQCSGSITHSLGENLQYSTSVVDKEVDGDDLQWLVWVPQAQRFQLPPFKSRVLTRHVQIIPDDPTRTGIHDTTHWSFINRFPLFSFLFNILMFVCFFCFHFVPPPILTFQLIPYILKNPCCTLTYPQPVTPEYAQRNHIIAPAGSRPCWNCNETGSAALPFEGLPASTVARNVIRFKIIKVLLRDESIFWAERTGLFVYFFSFFHRMSFIVSDIS